MRIFTTILMFDIVIGTSLMLYILVSWEMNKNKIVANGWTLSKCTPFRPWWAFLTFYIPIIGILWYLATGDLIGQLSYAKKSETNFITINFGLFEITYAD